MSRNTSPLHENGDHIHSIMDTMPDFTSLFERLTPEQVDAILDEQMASDTSAEGRSRETVNYGSNSIDSAYEELKAANSL